MDYRHVSPEIHLLTEDNRSITFCKHRYNVEKKPSPEECKGKIIGICLNYAFFGEQDLGIQPLRVAFGIRKRNDVVSKVPLKVIQFKGVKAIKYGQQTNLDKKIVRMVKEIGLIGYWDYANLAFCAAPEYSFLIDSIKEMFKPEHTRIDICRCFGGYDLLIAAF